VLRSDVIHPTGAAHNGRVFKRTGEGVLIEFRSVVDAVRCAIDVQNAMIERNAGGPAERRIEMRGRGMERPQTNIRLTTDSL